MAGGNNQNRRILAPGIPTPSDAMVEAAIAQAQVQSLRPGPVVLLCESITVYLPQGPQQLVPGGFGGDEQNRTIKADGVKLIVAPGELPIIVAQYVDGGEDRYGLCPFRFTVKESRKVAS